MRTFSAFEVQALRAERAARFLAGSTVVSLALVVASSRVASTDELEGFHVALEVWCLVIWGPLILRLGFFVVWLTRAFDWGIYLTRSPVLKARRAKGLVWIFLVPVVSSIRPFLAMLDLEGALESELRCVPPNDSAASNRPTRTLIRLWWGASVVLTLLQVALLTTQAALALALVLASTLLEGGSHVLNALVIRRITARLRELARRSHALG